MLVYTDSISVTNRTFQEGFLSRRLLVFTEQQVSFYCQGASWMESLGGLEYTRDQRAIFWPAVTPKCSLFGYSESETSSKYAEFHSSQEVEYTHHDACYRINEFSDLVRSYTRRQMTFDSDALNAFSGVAQYLQNNGKVPAIYCIRGLPYTHDDLLFYSLCWRRNERMGSSPPKRRLAFPSWTWASCNSEVYWPGRSDLLGGGETVSQMRDIAYGVASTSEEALASISLYDGKSLIQTAARNDADKDLLDRVTEIHFNARCVLPSDFSSRVNNLGEERSTWHGIELWGYCFYSLVMDSLITLEQFLTKLEAGVWSCLLLGASKYTLYILVIEWQDDETAVRVDWLLPSSFSPEVIPETDEWKAVRLL
jgi:hypothetical protein